MALPIITATGNLAGDPELNFGTTGNAYAKFRIACNENKKTDTGWETISTTWLRVTVWGQEAEAAAANLRKGQKVTVTGRLAQNDYEKDGITRTSFEIKSAQISIPLETEKKQTFEPKNDPWDVSSVQTNSYNSQEEVPF